MWNLVSVSFFFLSTLITCIWSNEILFESTYIQNEIDKIESRGEKLEIEMDRALYETNLDPQEIVAVGTTYRQLASIVGVACGYYLNKDGVFVSSFTTSRIYFVDTSNDCETTNNCQLTSVAGTGTSGITDGTFTTSTFSDPSRMVYLPDLDRLIVTDRANGLLRYLDFASQTVGSMRSGGSSGSKISVVGSSISDGNPEIDVKRSGNYLYISDSKFVYNLTGTDGTLSTAFNNGVLKRYNVLKSWQLNNGYDISTSKIYISSIAVNEGSGIMYVSYTFSRSAIVVLPLHAGSVSEISILVTDRVLYNIPQTYPVPRNGFLNSAQITGFSLVTFPMHMYYDGNDNVLYWVEVFSHLSAGTASGALGAVAVRRLKFADNFIDYYAGNVGVFNKIIGRSTGYADGEASSAIFSYPVTIAFKGHAASPFGLGPLIYVADYTNKALRRVYNAIDTKPPTRQPTISLKPTFRPTSSQNPTVLPTSSPTIVPTPGPTPEPTLVPSGVPSLEPTFSPSAEPTIHPTVSFPPTLNLNPTSVPTLLNGACLEVYLLDEFGDGWSGAALYVNHTGYSDSSLEHKRPKPKPDYVVSKSVEPIVSANPYVFDICASLDDNRYFQRGDYNLFIHNPKGSDLENDWEIFWQVKDVETGKIYTGDANTKMSFKFDESGLFTNIPPTVKLAPDSYSCSRCKHPQPPKKPQNPDPGPDGPKRFLLGEEHKVPFQLFDSVGDGWFDNSGKGIQFTISDSSKTHKLASGTICGDFLKEDCEVELEDGDYFFRVGGGGEDSGRDQVSWKFCGVSGNAQQELSFAIVNGKCISGSLRDAETIATLQEQTTLSIEGEFLISNVFSQTLTVKDIEVLEDALADALSVDPKHVTVLYYCVSEDGDYCTEIESSASYSSSNSKPKASRKSKSNAPSEYSLVSTFSRLLGATYTLDVVFVITLVTEDFGIAGSRYHEALSLAYDKSQALMNAYSTTNLQQSIRTESENIGASALKFVRVDDLIALSNTELKYDYVAFEAAEAETLSVPMIPHAMVVQLDESAAQETVLFLPFIFIAATVAAIFVYRRRQQVKAAGWRAQIFGSKNSNADASTELPSVSESRGEGATESTEAGDSVLQESEEPDIFMKFSEIKASTSSSQQLSSTLIKDTEWQEEDDDEHAHSHLNVSSLSNIRPTRSRYRPREDNLVNSREFPISTSTHTINAHNSNVNPLGNSINREEPRSSSLHL